MADKDADYDKSSEEDIAKWLARETGNAGEGTKYEPSKGMNLPRQRREDLGSFFEGLEIDKAKRDQRKRAAMQDVEDVEALRNALRPPLNPTNPTNPGGAY